VRRQAFLTLTAVINTSFDWLSPHLADMYEYSRTYPDHVVIDFINVIIIM
jgi:hypothetical protein